MDNELQYSVAAPGRVNLLGEHVDYNDGHVLPAAINRYVTLRFQPRNDHQICVHAPDLGGKVCFPLADIDKKLTTEGNGLPSWALYPAGAAWSLLQQGLPVAGMDAEYTSTIPIGSGLSSSAAVLVAFTTAWNYLAGEPLNGLERALAAQRAENQYVGVNCGLMDQFACANGVEGHALFFDTRSHEWEAVPLPNGILLVVADSGIHRSLATSAYNERRSACEQALRIIREVYPSKIALRDVSIAEYADLATHIPEPIRHYARHVIHECQRVQDAIPCLRMGDAVRFGEAMVECHRSLRDDYRVSLPELDILVDLAIALPGCLGARLTGAGFGGCTVNLVREECAADFVLRLAADYQRRTGLTAVTHLCRASAGARLITP